MRVLLIQAPLGRKQKPVYPLGLSYIAAALPDQYEVDILDANLQTQPEIQEVIARFRPDLIGLGLRNVDTTQSHDPFSYFRRFPAFVSWINQISIKSPLVVGGSGFSLFPREVMEACPEIDFGVELEGEATFPALLEHLNHPESVPGVYYRDGGKVRYTGIPDLPDFATLPSPHRILDPKPYQEEFFQLGVQTKRGCAHKCLYCDYPYLNGGKIRQRHPRLVVNELQHLAREQGIRRFAFADAIFNEPREHAEQICRDIVQRGLDLKWTAYFSIRCFDQDFLELATKAGCELFEFSPDGLRESTLRALQKGIGEDEIQRVMSLFEGRRQPRFALQLMFNVPGAEFKDFLLLCHAVFVWPRKYPSLEFVAITNMRIYPRTPLHRLAINERLILPEQNLVQPMFYDPWPLRPFSVLIHFGGRVRRGIMKLCGTYRF